MRVKESLSQSLSSLLSISHSYLSSLIFFLSHSQPPSIPLSLFLSLPYLLLSSHPLYPLSLSLHSQSPLSHLFTLLPSLPLTCLPPSLLSASFSLTSLLSFPLSLSHVSLHHSYQLPLAGRRWRRTIVFCQVIREVGRPRSRRK